MEKLTSLDLLIDYLKRLPSVGTKSAERMAYAILNMDRDIVEGFAASLIEVKDKVHSCPTCGLYTEHERCDICRDNERTSDTIIVVSSPKDIFGFERIDDFKGRYHVLGGLLSATSQVNPEDLKINELIARVESENIKEIIIATNPTIEGEITALYLARQLAGLPVKVSRIAYGLPMGGQVDYIDSLTLFKALENRREIK
ncbi:MAG: recombination mediator RecR [Bacilli bacterium]